MTNCGDASDMDCTATLERLFLFLDEEIDHASATQIQEHLDQCGPCLAMYDLERIVKVLVARSCCEQAPSALRTRVLSSIRATWSR